MNIKEKDNTYIANTYSRFPIVLTEGKGSVVFDEDGKQYIDMNTGIAVNIFGLCDDVWVEAVEKQLSALQHVSNLYYSAPDATLAEMLCERTGMKKVFFSNSGAEANECAIKAARKYAAGKKGPEYSTIITLKNSFHGRTITTLAATGQDVFHKDFLPLTDGFDYAEANNVNDLKEKVAKNKTAAIMFECVQGEGGVLPLERDFVNEIAAICQKEDILMIVDEVQTGNGRSGKLYSYMHYGVSPDIVTTAKGLGGGLPLGATMLGEKVSGVFEPGSHGSTFGGNPVCCAGAISILERIDDELLKKVCDKSKFIIDSLSGAKGVKSVTGMGLMLGIETEKDASEVISECMKNGVLVIKAKNKVRLLPALNIPDELLSKAVNVIKNACGGEKI
ncbi:MAG: acetylornithine/succinylornithine family transaminase [Oscillospiraceae bacterium]|nr:acetylornithine/succinylornithine family transaminase [Oscillospiraceae bacterium]